ncbi:MAG: outer membrane beta-barrel protein [Candidatus Poribacteria bacterium]|nr:outer membrane beta-barrel protein [Candidatus Poribacteria bacterium]
MNKFWIVILILLSVNLVTPSPINADSLLIDVEILSGIHLKRRLVEYGIPRSYSWTFENEDYTVILAVDQQEYNTIRNDQRKRQYNFKHFAPMVYKGVDSLEELINEFKQVIPKTWSEERRANFALSFVQSIPYKKDETTGYDREYYKHPIETLTEGGGDCEDTSMLFASILSGLGFKSALLDLPGHLAVGVKGNFQGYFVPYGIDKYYYCETTNPGWKLGNMPKEYVAKRVRVIPITPNPVPPKQVTPQIVTPRPQFPSSPSPQRTLQNGINLYKDARYNEAIKSLQLALSGLSKSEQRGQVYIYLGAAELGFGKSIPEVKDRFQEALRQNPNQELPWPNHQKFKPLFEEARRESIGKLTISVSLPPTEIWIDGNEINRKKLGTGTSRVNLKLFKGTYTIEAVYEGVSKKQKIVIVPNTHKELEIEIPPIAKHTPVSEVSIGEIIPLTLSLTSRKRPNQVKIHYNTYDKNNKELGRNNKKMLLSRRDPASLTWTYEVDLPSQKRAGSIRYYIQVEYEDRMVIRHPKSRYRYHQISITDDASPIDNKFPTIVLRNPPKIVNVDQETTIRVEVTDDTAVKSVYLFYAFSRSRNLRPSQYYRRVLTKTYSDIYTGRISPHSDPGYVWYYVTATDREGNEGKTEKKVLEIKPSRKPTPPPSDNQPPKIALQDTIRTTNVNQQIPVKAKVTDNTVVKSVYLFYGFSRSRFSEPSKYYMKALTKNTLDTYTGHISPQREIGYVWYYLTAIDRAGNQSKSEKRLLQIKSSRPDPPPKKSDEPSITVVNKPIIRQEIWANYAWSNNVLEGDAISLTYLCESKNYQTFGGQLDYFYQNPSNMSATFHWGSDLGKVPITFTFLGGVARYSNVNESIYITPILGAGLKYYPRDEVAIDVTGLVKLPSTFDTTFFYNCELGARFYINDSLNLKIGFSQWYLGSRNITRMQLGFGFIF